MRRIEQGSSIKPSAGFRRMMLMVVAFAYLFVGMAHHVACFDHAVAAGTVVAGVDDDVGDDDGTSPVAICDHCPSCVPGLLPVPVMAAVPSMIAADTVLSVVPVMITDHPGLDTPPPKLLT